MIDIGVIGMLRVDVDSMMIMSELRWEDIGHDHQLELDVHDHGVQVPVILGPGWMIDGRHRYMAAIMAGQRMMPYEYDQGRREHRGLRPVSAWQDPRGLPIAQGWV